MTNFQKNCNRNGDTVTPNVVFAGKNTMTARYVMMYRDGKLANDVSISR